MPAIHVFAAASKEVDGRHEPGHDDENAPVAVAEFHRTAVARAWP
jgi:hypothetical protein